MACGKLAGELKQKLTTFGFEITREVDLTEGCIINFRDPRIFRGVKKVASEVQAIHDATGSISISKDGRFEVNIPTPTKSFIEWYISCKDKMYKPHTYVRDKYAIFGFRGNGLDWDDLDGIFNAVINARNGW